jgi:hypothetical protein
MPAFVQGLKDGGFIEGRNILIEIRQADGHYDRSFRTRPALLIFL